MSTQQTLYGLGHSNTKKKFKFVLNTKDYGQKILRYAPQGWQEGELTFIRDKKYKGVFEKYSTNSLTFVKDGRDYVQTAYEAGGVDYEISIDIYLLNNSTFQYEIYFSGKLDLSTYRINSVGVECELVEIGFRNIVLKRDSLDVDLFSEKFIGGSTMEQLTAMPINLTLSAYSAVKNVDWNVISNALPGQYTTGIYVALPATIFFNEFSETEIFEQTVSVESPFTSSKKFFVPADNYAGELVVDLEITMFSNAGTDDMNPQLEIYRGSTIVKTVTATSSEIDDDDQKTFRFQDTSSFSVTSSQEYRLFAYIENNNQEFTIDEINGSVSYQIALVTEIPAVVIKAFPIYEFVTRILQLISGKTTPFYSEFLGRTDSTPETYASDGDGSLLCVTKGRLIRSFPYGNTSFNASVEDIFDTLNAIYNVGMSFETISSVEKVRIEDEKYFYNVSVNPDFATDNKYWKVNQILDLTDNVTDEIIEKEVVPDLYANEIRGGYSDYEYENVQGLKEFNTKTNWATPVKAVKNELDLVSVYRADTQGVNKLRDKPYADNPTEDVNGDDDNFIFDVKRESPFTVKTDDDFDLAVGGVDPDQSYNLRFTPRRNLEKHGNRIRSMQLDAAKEIQWLSSEKNNSLKTKKTGESSLKAENGDILIDDLTVGYWVPEYYIFEAPTKVYDSTESAEVEVVDKIKDNPYGVIKIASDKYGWIEEVQLNNETGLASFKLLKVDTSNVKIID